MDANELRLFFRLSSDLHLATREGQEEAISDALMELVGLWLHSTNAKVRARCTALLEIHGMRGQMDELCEQWAR